METSQGPLALGIFLFILVSSSSAVKECSLGCHGSPGCLLYQTGTNYKYKFEGTTVTRLAGSDKDVAKLGLSAVAEVSPLSECGYTLTLSDVFLTGPDGKKYPGGQEFVSHPIQFSMNNGKLHSELCTSSDESFNSLNVKRAILSLLQSSVNKDSGSAVTTEHDVFGVCTTGYEFSKSSKGVNVRKTRDLNKCSHREDINLPFLASSYYVPSDFQTSPLLEAYSLVEQNLVNGVVKQAKGEEKYRYQPVKGGVNEEKSGVYVFVQTQLTLISQAAGAPNTAAVTEERSVMFDVPHQEEGETNAKTVLSALKEASDSMDPIVGESGARNFNFLVKTLAKTKKADILSVYSHVKSGAGFKNKNTAKKTFLEAIFRTETADSSAAMAELLVRKEVTGLKARMWLLGLGLVKHASRTSLTSVLPLLEGEPSTETYLGVGMLAGKFCREHHCQGVPEFENVEAKLAAPLFAGCHPENLDAEDHLIASLKGLANTRHLSHEVAEKVAQCAGDHTVRTRVRVSAFETMHSDPNKDTFKTVAAETLKDQNEDAELRVKAYLVLVECPCPKTAALLQEVLNHEKYNQVGSFIVSHLRNLRASTNPDKKKAGEYFKSVEAHKKFPFDFRKFSQNYEVSYSFDAMNVGATAESNVLYSQKSYVPRSLSLNLTTQLFGHAFNWLEVDARVENLDYVLEKWFGPKGYFKSKSTNEVYEEGSHKLDSFLEKVMNRYKETMRPKRSTHRPQLEALEKKVKVDHDAHDSVVDFDLSMKTYGSEVAWFNFHSSDPDYLLDKLVDEAFDQLDVSVNQAKNFNVDYKKHLQFLDGEVAYPTGLGLPLKFSVLGTAAVSLKVDGKIDLPAILKDPKNADLKFQFVPSAAVEVVGTLTVDGGLVESGVKVCLNLHTATGTDFTLRVLNGNGVDVKLGLPLEKQDLITLTTDSFSVVRERGHHEVDTPVEFSTKNEEYKGCFDWLSELVGFTFCGEVSTPFDGHKMFLPSWGPSRLSLQFLKDDPNLTTYHFKTYFHHKAENGHTKFEVLFDTPNSSKNRKVNFLVDLGLKPKTYLKVEAISPIYSASFEGNLVNTKKEVTLNAKLSLPDGEDYSMKAGAYVTGGGNSVQYKPVLEYKGPERSASALVGRKGAKQGQGFYVTGTVNIDKNSPHDVTYTFNDLCIHTPGSKYTVSGKIMRGEEFVNTDLKVLYDTENVVIKGKLDLERENNIHNHLEVVSSQFPDLSFSVTWDLDWEESNYQGVKSTLVVVHGPDPKSMEPRVTLHNYFAQKDDSSFDFKMENTVTYPLLGVEGKLNGAVSAHELSYDVKAQFSEFCAESSLDGKFAMKDESDYDVNLKGKFTSGEGRENSVHLHLQHDLVGPGKSRVINSVELVPGGKYALKAIVLHKFENDFYDFHVDSELHLPTEPKLVKMVFGTKHAQDLWYDELKVSVDGKDYVDMMFDLRTMPTDTLKFKAHLPGYLNTDGEFVFEKQVLKGNAELELPRSNRKMDFKMDLAVAPSQYVGYAEMCWDAGDRKKTLKVETNSHISEDSFNTKNTVHFKGKKSQVNAKAKMTGTLDDGTVSGEVELILPTSQHLVAKLSRSMHEVPGNTNGEWIVEFLNHATKGAKPTKAELKVVAKNVDLEKAQFDGQVSLNYANPEDQDLHFNLNLKKMPSGKTSWTVNGMTSLTGSLIEHPLSAKLESDIDNGYFTGDDENSSTFLPYNYHLTCKYGPGFSFDFNGKANGRNVMAEFGANFPKGHTVYDVYNIKWTTSSVFDLAHGPNTLRKVKTNEVLKWNDDKFYKFNCEFTEEVEGFNFDFDWEGDSQPKRSVSGSAHHHEEGNESTADFSMTLTSENNAEVTIKAESHNEDFSVHALGQLPETGKFDMLFKTKMIKEHNGLHFESVVDLMNKRTVTNAKFEFLQDHPLVDVVVDHPEGKSKLFWKYDRKSPKHLTQELKVKWTRNGGGSFVSDGEVNFEDLDNLVYRVNVDCAPLNMDKFQFEMLTKPSVGKGPGKKLMFSAKKADKVWFAGSSTYTVKDSGDKKTIEGTGNLKVGDQSYPLTVSYVTSPYHDGKQHSLSAKAGKYSLNVLHKKATNEYHVERVFCYEPESCSKAEISSKSERKSDAEKKSHVVVMLDFSLFNPKLHDFVMKIHTKTDHSNYEETALLQWSEEGKVEWEFHDSDVSAGFKLVLPQRTVAGELTQTNSEQLAQGEWKVEGSLWLDKARSPNKRTHILLEANLKQVGTSVVSSAEASFSHPALSKKLMLKGKSTMNEHDKTKPFIDAFGEIDIFSDPSQIINVHLKTTNEEKKPQGHSTTTVLTVKSNGCHLDMFYEEKATVSKSGMSYTQKFSYVDSDGARRECLGKIEATPSKFYLLMKFPAITLIEANVKTEKKEHQVQFVGTYDLAGTKYKEKLVLQDTPHLKYQFTFSKVGSEKMMEVNMGLNDHGEIAVTFDKTKVFNLQVDLSEANFLNTKYHYDSENVKKLYETSLEEAQHLSKQYETGIETTFRKLDHEVEYVLVNLKSALPDFDPMIGSYLQQLEGMKNEILEDKALQAALADCKESLSAVLEYTVVWIEESNRFWSSLYQALEEANDKLQMVLEESFPELKKSLTEIAHLVLHFAEEWLNFYVKCFDFILDQLKEHEETFKAVVDACSSYLHDFSQMCSQFVRETYHQLEEFVLTFKSQLEQFPLVENMEEAWDNIKSMRLSEETAIVLMEFLDTIFPYMPTPELANLVSTCKKYLELGMSKGSIPKEAWNEMYNELVAAARSLAHLLSEALMKEDIHASSLLTTPVVEPLNLPKGGLRLSLLHWLTSHDLPNLEDVLRTYFLPSFNPLDHLPPFENVAVLVGGTEVVTFDGNHFSFKGTCSYVLAEDYVNGNFCLTANVVNGKLKSLTVYDDHDSVELRHNQSPLVNGKPTEYPIQQGHMKAWRRPAGVGFWSDAGLLITCGDDCDSCVFQLSGFYFNKLGGLFGKPNYEPYDDLALPGGEVAENPAQFANSWKVDDSCPDVAHTAHTHVSQPLCTEFFEEDDNLMSCTLMIDPEPYRHSCDHLVAAASNPEAKKMAACNIAKAYAFVCREKGNFLTEVPETCITCKMGADKVEYDESRTVKLGKSADVLFVVEQLKSNEKLFNAMVPSLLNSLKNDFKEKGVNDVYFGLVGFNNPKNNWPTYFSTNGKFMYNGKSAVQFNEQVHRNSTLVDKFMGVVDDLKVEFGVTPRSNVYWDLGEAFNFRPHSYKIVIGVHAEPCETGAFFLSFGLIKSAVGFAMFKYSGIDFHYVILDEVKLQGDESKCVVGYDGDNYFSLADAKQKPLKGTGYDSSELVQEEFDVCTSLTTTVGGNVFSGGNFLKEKPAQRKQFISVMSQKIVEKAKDHDETFECTCEMYHGLLPHNRCVMEDFGDDSMKSAQLKAAKGHRKH